MTDDSDQADAEGLAILALTRKGERVMVPTFGTTDPVFDQLSVAELNVGLLDFGPAIHVATVNVSHPTDTTQRVELSFDTNEHQE